ncbi:MAG: hypothetical protein ACYT04_59960, partial [Nostoc sp.]
AHLPPQINDFSCTVKFWDGEYTVGLQYLKSFNYLPAECGQMRLVCDRIGRVYSDSLEETVKNLLQSLGEAESTLFNGCGREVVECSKVRIWGKITLIR